MGKKEIWKMVLKAAGYIISLILSAIGGGTVATMM